MLSNSAAGVTGLLLFPCAICPSVHVISCCYFSDLSAFGFQRGSSVHSLGRLCFDGSLAETGHWQVASSNFWLCQRSFRCRIWCDCRGLQLKLGAVPAMKLFAWCLLPVASASSPGLSVFGHKALSSFECLFGTLWSGKGSRHGHSDSCLGGSLTVM